MKIVQIPNFYKQGYPVGLHIIKWLEVLNCYIYAIQNVVGLRKLNVGLVCTGSSGAMLSALIVAQLKIDSSVEIIHIKKDGEDSHSGSASDLSEYDELFFIDDFVSMGFTLNRILSMFPTYDFNVVVADSVYESDLHGNTNVKSIYCRDFCTYFSLKSDKYKYDVTTIDIA